MLENYGGYCYDYLTSVPSVVQYILGDTTILRFVFINKSLSSRVTSVTSSKRRTKMNKFLSEARKCLTLKVSNKFLTNCSYSTSVNKNLFTQVFNFHISNLQEPLCIILGNDSCDLDSAVCALALAFFYTKHPRSIADLVSGETPIIPVLNTSRTNLALKTEVTYFLNKNNIHQENVICR